MEREYLFFALEVGAIFGGLFFLIDVLWYLLFPDSVIPVSPLLIAVAPFFLAGIAVTLKQKQAGKVKDTLIAGGISGAVIGLTVFFAMMALAILNDFRMHGEYTSSNSGFLLVGYCCMIGSAVMWAVGGIAGAIATTCAMIMLRIYRRLKGR